MTTPKEALERIAARSIAQDDDDEKELRRQLYHIEALAKSALAYLEGDAVERVARIIDPNAGWGVKLDSDYIDLRHEQARLEDKQRIAITKARAILATGLVPDEAAVRAELAEVRQEAADGLAVLDAIADYVGCPHDEELTVDHVRQHYMKLENSAQRQGLEDAGRIANAQAYSAERESAIRADEREKCAKVAVARSDAVMAEAEAAHDDDNYDLYERLECEAGNYMDLAAAIRSGES